MEAKPTSQVPAAGSSSNARSPLPVQDQPENVSDVPPPTRKPESKVNIPPLSARSDTLLLPSSQPDSPACTQLPPSSEPFASSSQRTATPGPPLSRPKLALKPKPKPVTPVFRSFSPTPERATSLKKKTLPKISEGHFTTLLTSRLGHLPRGDRSESEEEETDDWPPVRGKKGKEKDMVPGPIVVSSSAVQEHERHPISRVEAPTSRQALVPPTRESDDRQAHIPPHRQEPKHHPFSQVLLPPPPSPHNRTDADVGESPLKHRSTNRTRQLVQNLRDRKRGNLNGASTSVPPPLLPLLQPVAGPSIPTTAAVRSGFASPAEIPPKLAVVAHGAPPMDEENTPLPSASTLTQIPTGSASRGSSTITAIQQTGIPSKGDSPLATDVHPVVPLEDRSSRPAAPARRPSIQLFPEPSSLFLPDKGEGRAERRGAEPPLTHAQRLLTRGRKQHRRRTLQGYEYDDVPSIDLTRARSTASTSRIPRSRGSTSASVSRLPHRHSLPAHSTPSAIPADLSGYLTTPDQPGPAILPVPPALITPADIPLSASIGFSTLISRIAAAHGYTPSVVLEIYKRLGSLKDAEAFVRAMRNATEEWVGAEFERREREARGSRGASRGQSKSDSGESSETSDDAPPRGSRHGPSFKRALEHQTPNGLHVRYVPPPDESDYEPPPTSRAAWWKRASMGGVDSVSASWGAIATGRYKTKEVEVAEHKMEEVEDIVDNDGDEDASGEDDEESQDDIERAEEESVAEELVPESPPEGLRDEDALAPNLKQDSEIEPRHHEFSQAHTRHHAMHMDMKRESPTHRMHGDPEPFNTSTPFMAGTCDSSWNADEDRALLSANWETLKILEGRRGKAGIRQRVVQLLR